MLSQLEVVVGKVPLIRDDTLLLGHQLVYEVPLHCVS